MDSVSATARARESCSAFDVLFARCARDAHCHLMQVVEAAARRALAAERAQQHGIQTARQAPLRPVLDDSSPSTSGPACFFC